MAYFSKENGGALNVTCTDFGGRCDQVYVMCSNGENSNGDPYKAHFSLQSGRTEFFKCSNPRNFLKNITTTAKFSIKNIGMADGETILFGVRFDDRPCDAVDLYFSPCVGEITLFRYFSVQAEM